MNAEAATYVHELTWLFGEMAVSLKGLTGEQLNWRPASTANSAYMIVSHVLGVTRV